MIVKRLQTGEVLLQALIKDKALKQRRLRHPFPAKKQRRT